MTTPVASTPPGTTATARATPVATDPNEKGDSEPRLEAGAVAVPGVPALFGDRVSWCFAE